MNDAGGLEPGRTPQGRRRWIDGAAWLALIALVTAGTGVALWLIGLMGEIRLEVRPLERVATSADQPATPPARANPAATDEAPEPVPPVTYVRPDGVVVTTPAWVRAPTPRFPDRATDVEAGVVSLKCETLASGLIGACEVLEETPPGRGFGEAALASTRDARVQPNMLNGEPTDGSIRFRVRFRLR